MTDALTRAITEVTEDNLRLMVLDLAQLPPKFRGFEPLRNGILDNTAMAEQGFPGDSGETLRGRGRITGYLREFVSPVPSVSWETGTDIAAGTTVHLFDDQEAVSTWITEVFVKGFEENVGKMASFGHKLLSVEQLEVRGFHDEAVSLKAVQEGPNGIISSTVADFRLGRLLGVAFSVSVGDVRRRALTERLGTLLERQMVRVVLGAE